MASTPKAERRESIESWPFVRWVASRNRWIVDARTKNGGERRFFKTKPEAQTWRHSQLIRRQNEGDVGFDDRELAQHGWSVADAIRFACEHLRRTKQSCGIPAAIAALVESKRNSGKSPQYCKDLTNRLTRLASTFPDATLASLTTADLDGFLHSLPVEPGTKNTFRRDIRTLWGFAEKRGWAEARVAKHTEAATITAEAPGILTVKQAAALMDASTDPVLCAFHAIGLFAGLRVAEIRKLDWSDVDLDGGFIHVSAAKSKTRSRRLVPILDNLRSWLEPIATTGPVVSKELRTLHENARTTAKITKWPDNALRHSFVSYRLASTGDAAQTALESGHDQAVLFRHYRELVKPAEAEKFFRIAR